MPRKIIQLGKIDFLSRGKKDCLAEIEISWDGKNFSASGTVWEPGRADWLFAGQNLEEICSHFPQTPAAQALLSIWREWHLNDLTAGSPSQRTWLGSNPMPKDFPDSHYEWASKALASAGLNPDASYLYDGKPYAYGSAWLFREIPADIVEQIEKLMGTQP